MWHEVGWRGLAAFGDKPQNGVDFIVRYVEDFGDLLKGQTGFEIFEDGLDEHARSLEHPRSADFAGDALDG